VFVVDRARICFREDLGANSDHNKTSGSVTGRRNRNNGEIRQQSMEEILGLRFPSLTLAQIGLEFVVGGAEPAAPLECGLISS